MGTLNPKIPSQELNQELESAAVLMHDLQQNVLTPELLLLNFLQRRDSAAHRLIVRILESQKLDLAQLYSTADTMARMRTGRPVNLDFVDSAGRRIPLSNEMTRVLDTSLTLAEQREEFRAGTEHVLLAMAQPGMTTSGVLQRFGLTPIAMDQAAGSQHGPLVDLVALARGDDFPPTYQRTELLQKLQALLNLTRDRHVILVGPAGVGKESLVFSLAAAMAAGQPAPNGASVIQIAERVLVDNPVKALENGLQRAREGILYLPHIHRFFGGRLDAEFYEAGAPLRKALLSNRVTIVGATDQASYDRLMAKNSTVIEHTHPLVVSPASVEETIAILQLHRPLLERDYRLTIEPAALEATAHLAERYLPTTPLPGAAMDLIHRSAAGLRSLHTAQDLHLDSEDLTLTLSQMTGIPVTKLGADERSRYARMVEHLHQRIIGQEEAVMAVSRAVKTARVGLKDPNRPIGSFLFLGPTGVGKTELAKALAEFMFGDEDAAIELDMSEYQQEHSVNRLIGAPPGYVGYEGGGQLTEAVRERPYSVVLFDEVEKAHTRVADILLQIMEEGRLTDGQGRTTRFSETVIILTSNLGSEFLVDPAISEAQRELVNSEVKSHFRPEFLNRLDDTILFHPLSPEHLRLILDLMLKKEVRLAAGSGVELDLTPAAKEWLLAQNDHPEWGARPLRRILRRYLREPLADFILRDPPQPGTLIHVDCKAEKLAFART